jgi:murein DD-endopeptidase
MKFIRIRTTLVGLALIAVIPALSQQLSELLEIKVLFKPETVLINGQPTLYYELRLVNSSGDSLFLQSLNVSRQGGLLLRTIEKNDLRKSYSTEKKTNDQQEVILSPHASAILYLETIVSGNTTGALTHRLLFKTKRDPAASLQVTGAPLIMYTQPVAVLVGPPVRDGEWAAVYDPSWERGHRRVVYAPDGKSRIPGRFAIDFIKLDQQGKYANGDENEIKNWLGYGATVIAVAP